MTMEVVDEDAQLVEAARSGNRAAFSQLYAGPAAVATDLGCAFTLEAGENGEDRVRVTSGWVEFHWEDRQELIPAGPVGSRDARHRPRHRLL